MANRDVMAIGTSAGGVPALKFLAKSFRPDFPAAILVTIHLSIQHRSSLDAILSSAGPLPASFGENGEPAKKGHIYLAPPGSHLLLDGGDRLLLGGGPYENNVRPAIDPMLRSAAVCCACRSVGVVLTGTMGDGASGLWALQDAAASRWCRTRATPPSRKCRRRRCSARGPTTSRPWRSCRGFWTLSFDNRQGRRSRSPAASGLKLKSHGTGIRP